MDQAEAVFGTLFKESTHGDPYNSVDFTKFLEGDPGGIIHSNSISLSYVSDI